MDIAVNLDPKLAGGPDFLDLVMVNGDLSPTADVIGGTTHPVLQDVQIRLRTFLGEFFMDLTLGMPWRDLMQGATSGQSQLDAVVQNCILTTPGILQLTTYRSSVNTRQRLMSISFSAVSTQGPISYQSTVTAASQATGATT
jgi:hypothetical protein